MSARCHRRKFQRQLEGTLAWFSWTQVGPMGLDYKTDIEYEQKKTQTNSQVRTIDVSSNDAEASSCFPVMRESECHKRGLIPNIQ